MDSLGTPKDTVDHRRRIAELYTTIQRLAKGVKEGLTGLHAEEGGGHAAAAVPSAGGSKTRKLLTDFAAMLQVCVIRASDRYMYVCMVRDHVNIFIMKLGHDILGRQEYKSTGRG